MTLARGYEPITKLGINLMASGKPLSKMGFPVSEIDKIDGIFEERKHFEKRSRELAKLSPKSDLGVASGSTTNVKTYMCDICGNVASVGCIKLTSPEQEKNIPIEWRPYALNRLGSLATNDYRAYLNMPSGIVIDYPRRKVYVVCGNCRIVLGLKPTESVILVHKIEDKGYGMVDLDRVERLTNMYNALKSNGNIISPFVDFDFAVQMTTNPKDRINYEQANKFNSKNLI
jgi:hypothetical protein